MANEVKKTDVNVEVNNSNEARLAPDQSYLNAGNTCNSFLESRSPSSSKYNRSYIRTYGIARYNHALENLIPIRQTNRQKESMPADKAGLFSYIFITWMTRYLWKAHKTGLTLEDLPEISPYDAANYNAQRLESLWQEELSKKGPSNASFSRTAWKFVRTRICIASILLTCSVIFGFISPAILMRNLLEHLQSPDGTFWDGMKWVILLTMSDFMRTVFFTWTWVTNFRTAIRLKSACTMLLYKKLISLTDAKVKNSGKLINLFSNDSQRLFDVVIYGPMIISGPIVTVCGITYILWLFNPLALLGMTAFLLFYPCQYLISRITGYFRANSVKITDTRVRLINEILECIKLIKMYAWEKYFSSRLLDVRKQEERWLHKTAYFQSLSISLTPAVPVIAAIITFLAHVASGSNLTAAQVFPFVSLLNTQIRSLFMFLQVGLINITESKITLRRTKNIILLDGSTCQISKPIVKSEAIAISSGTFICEKMALQNDASENRNDKQRKKVTLVKENDVTTGEAEQLNELNEESKYFDVLTDIKFVAPKGALIGICGPVGSGKSSLLLAALGQLKMRKGHISREGSCAYVSQQAWIVNATFRENILFGEQFNAKRYYHALTVCNLKEDINVLVGGDQTEIGERGINLSGGQKQRVALARALYADRDIYFLDDPLSAVDPHVGFYIFENLILNALQEKTVLLVTHQVQFLKRCDHVYMMHSGTVIEDGTHEELMELNGEYASMVNNIYSETPNRFVRETETAEAHIETSIASMADGQVTIPRTPTDYSGKRNSAGDPNTDTPQFGARLMAEDKTEKGTVKSSTYRIYVKAAGGYIIAALVFFAFFLNLGSSAFSSWWLAIWINAGSGNATSGSNVTEVENINDNPDFQYYYSIYASCIGAILVTSFLRGLAIIYTTINASTVLHNRVFKKMMASPLQFFETIPAGRIQNIFSRDIDEVDNYLPISIENMVQNIFTCSFAILFICFVLPWFCLPLVVLGALFFIVSKLFRTAIRDLKRMEAISRAPVLSFVTTTMQGLSTIHAFQKEKDFISKFEGLFDLNSLCLYMCQAGMRWSAVRLDSLAIASTFITALLVTIFKGEISPALAGLALAYSAQMSGMFQYTVRLMSETEVRFISVERIKYYIKTLAKEGVIEGTVMDSPDNWPVAGKIEFKNVSMRYRKDLPLILDDVSFTVESRQNIGIVGRTGSGKSSLVCALFRLVELSKGVIEIDAVDLSKIDLQLLRSKLSIIPQDPVLFSGSIRSNLDPFNENTEADIWSSLEKTQLKKKVQAMDGQLDASVGFGGNNLSAGERQLLCLTRALLRDSKILILDEATAAVDPETEMAVQATVKNEFADCTVIMIAHRLQTVISCDRILVMSQGNVVEYDTPAKLLANPQSEFSKLMAIANKDIAETITP